MLTSQHSHARIISGLHSARRRFYQRSMQMRIFDSRVLTSLWHCSTGGIVLSFVAAAEVGMLRSLEESLGFIIEEMPINVSPSCPLLAYLIRLENVKARRFTNEPLRGRERGCCPKAFLGKTSANREEDSARRQHFHNSEKARELACNSSQRAGN
jgi:hypothetical protein